MLNKCCNLLKSFVTSLTESEDVLNTFIETHPMFDLLVVCMEYTGEPDLYPDGIPVNNGNEYEEGLGVSEAKALIANKYAKKVSGSDSDDIAYYMTLTRLGLDTLETMMNDWSEV